MLLERDGDPVPSSATAAWDAWPRKGVAQFRQPHNLMPGFRQVLDRELPDVQDALVRAGAARWDMVNPLPPAFEDRTPRPIDAELWTWTARRPVVEHAFAAAAAREPRLTIRRGTQAAALLADAPRADGVPHVTGVRTDRGEAIAADLVVDATGRASRSPDWLRAAGARPPAEDQADCGFIYYTRYFAGSLPARRAGALTPLGSISLLTLAGDNGTWSVTVFLASDDQPLKTLRREDVWTRVVRECPLHAHWLDGEPITGVLAMGGIVDRYRSFVVDGTPVATGFAAVADAWACTNPSAGRGLTVGLKHAVVLRDAIRDAGRDPRALVERLHERTEAEMAPWYHAQVMADRARYAEMDALRSGRAPTPPADAAAREMGLLFAAMGADPDLFRAALEYVGTMTPVQSILARPEIAARLHAAAQKLRAAPPRPAPGPTRDRLLELAGST
jgi:2-polyprenyl-6-methoxyphenol hydroxylase-like FAD-dependent oxidoreductase